MLKRLLAPFATLLFLCIAVCCKRTGVETESSSSWKLVKIDSFTVNYTKEIHGVAFNGRTGVFYHFKDVSLTQFDNKGNLLGTAPVPEDGPEAMGYIVGMRYRPDGSLLLQSLNGEIGIMDSSLTLQRHLQMPFQSTLPTLRSNVKSLDSQGNDVLVYFPGRNGTNPFEKGYFKNNFLLEKIDLESGEVQPVFKLAPESKFQEDTYHDTPYVLIAVGGHDEVLYVLDNDPIIHRYVLRGNDVPSLSIPLEARKFIQVTPQPIPLGNMDGVYPGVIDGIHPITGGFAVTYGEGLTKEEVDNQRYADPRALKSIQRNVLKFYFYDKGWSDEIDLPREISEILYIEGPEGISYGLKNVAFGGSQTTNQVTIYKLAIESTGSTKGNR
ncbi:hypothetical protein [Lunatimonas lonarensis]|uniref:hypothetical protein n=1 Tax=Lunatimonas lonarensis TaxID=1232681 RepID=UPI0012DE4ABB|nr:hypothetical protein [Lunatimonas lonarensis]